MCILSAANEQQEEFSECHLTKMPDEVMAEVLFHLNAIDRSNLGRSCRRFYSLDYKIGRKKFYRVRMNVLESGYTFLFSTSPGHMSESTWKNELRWKISFKDISSSGQHDQRLTNVFHNSRFDSLEIIVNREHYHDVSFLHSLLRDQNIRNSQITVDFSPGKSVASRISEHFSRIITTGFRRTASNARFPHPSRPEYEEGKMEVFADSLLGHLVSASMVTTRGILPFTAQAIIDAFQMTGITEEPKLLHIDVRAAVSAEVEAILRNDPEMYRNPRGWLVHRPSRCVLMTVTPEIFVDWRFRQLLFTYAFLSQTAIVIAIMACYFVLVYFFKARFRTVSTVRFEPPTVKGQRTMTIQLSEAARERNHQEQQLIYISLIVCTLEIINFLFYIYVFGINTKVDTRVFYFFYNALNDIYSAAPPYLLIVFCTPVRERVLTLLHLNSGRPKTELLSTFRDAISRNKTAEPI